MKKIISFALVLTLALSLCLVGCNDNPTGKVADNTEHLTQVTKTCKLTKSYEGKSFLSEGIGEASLVKHTDGDTFTVKLKKEGTNEVIRFHSVDTPESTGGVEKWGKAASLFVEKQIKPTTQLVLEATATSAEKDSYGSRYLGYVWYRDSETEEFKNLNLELVENGFSENTGSPTSKFPYNSYFDKAQAAAQRIKLRIWSDKDDPLYSEDPVETSIKEIYDNLEEFYNDEYNSGAKVKFTACLTSLTLSATGTYTFTAVDYNRETGETYSIAVYAGYTSSSGSRMKIGHLYKIVGTLQKHSNNLQVSGVKFDSIFGENQPNVYSNPIQKNYYLTFSNDEAFIANYSDTLYSEATVVSSETEGGVLTVTATAKQRTKEGFNEEEVTFTFIVKVDDGFVNNFTAGKTFGVKGYKFDKDKNEITVLKLSDIVLK